MNRFRGKLNHGNYLVNFTRTIHKSAKLSIHNPFHPGGETELEGFYLITIHEITKTFQYCVYIFMNIPCLKTFAISLIIIRLISPDI